jgi:hypothetical protein
MKRVDHSFVHQRPRTGRIRPTALGALISLVACGTGNDHPDVAGVYQRDNVQIMAAAGRWVLEHQLQGIGQVALDYEGTAEGPDQVELRHAVASALDLRLVNANRAIVCKEAPAPAERSDCSFAGDLQVLLTVEQPQFGHPSAARIHIHYRRQWNVGSAGKRRSVLGYENWLFEAKRGDDGWTVQPLQHGMS